MTLSRIMCATDFSIGADAALRVAARLASEQNAELVLAHAWSLPAAAYLEGYAYAPDVLERLSTEAQRGLDAAASVARAAGVQQVSTTPLSGPAWRAITEMIAGDPKIELVVIGTRGQTSSLRIPFGSVATQIVRHADCSVLVVRSENQPAPFDHIVCAIDFSESSWHALELAATLGGSAGRGITLIHVVEPPNLADVERSASAELERWATQLRGIVNVNVSTRLHAGNAGTEVLAAIDGDPSIDLVITGSNLREGLERILLGSVAEKIVRYSKPPVLVARKRT